MSNPIVTVNGARFVVGSLVYFNNVGRAPTFISATQLSVTGSVGGAGGSKPVWVRQPSGIDSNTLYFEVTVPVLDSINPISAPTGLVVVDLYGQNFSATATAYMGGVAATQTNFVDSTHLVAMWTRDTAGIFQIMVMIGVASNAINFTVT